MTETSARLLRLLSLLQEHRDWSGAELADRLRVTVRTVRRDIDRLRDLGYPVDATQGIAGYRLGAGSALPPLLLDDEEALAVAVGLRTVAGGTVAGIEEASLRSLAKLEQVLPSRLRHRLATLQRSMVRVGATAPRVDPDVLIALSEACDRRERLRFDYTDHGGRQTIRATEPVAVVNFSRHWYLVAWDVGRDDWRSFRVDRLRPKIPTGPRFTPRELPGGDVVAYLSQRLSDEAWSWRATVVLHRPAAALTDRIWPGMGVLEAVDDTSSLLHVGADTPWSLAWMISSLDVDFTVTGPPELVEAVRALGDRCRAATG
ncbi:putative DNA-binding transcriptional regulator YafY [Nocardia transvalensis]|uniref:Putative DNA-binding transcriptional regulator YafY n=1 Tax=Nocardia transvalensis TaxID=37333 RepID=A0A7W9UKF0_9NOCA|nr:WYL domain-containing protein [Nocardia transvalensis]MBB5916414.1 putative DNA-binding transcriptional regulator YafY [Nocardia transvalensis]